MEENIAALATPMGEGGIAIVRVSGNTSLPLVNSMFKSRSGKPLDVVKSHTLTLGWIYDKEWRIIDEVLVGIMRAPHSYTGQDVVEINCHGGQRVARRCLEAVLKSGARLANPGEFTKRAFLLGRIDMTQAEAVIDVIRAKGDRALELAARNLMGALSKDILEIEEKMVSVNSRLEASIDFPDEVGDPDLNEIKDSVLKAIDNFNRIIAGGKRTRVYKEGIRIALAGKPNVGKSTLLNTLLRKERAIVTNIPGTTRDVIEDYILIEGIPVRIMDTAGIRETNDEIEKIGVNKSLEALTEADIVLVVLDSSKKMDEEDRMVLEATKDQKRIIILNKQDIEINEFQLDENIEKGLVIKISAKFERNISPLENAIKEIALSNSSHCDGEEIMVNMRQEKLILKAREYLSDVLQGIEEKMPLDCLAVDAWGAVKCLEELTGKQIREDIIDKIFTDFCIGK